MESRRRHPIDRAAASRRHLVSYGLLALALAALAAPLGSAARSGPSVAKLKVVTVKARDNGFTLSAKKAPAGTVRFVVKNVGKRKHNFRIAGKKTPVLKPGKTTKLVVKFAKARSYPYVSTLAGDVRRGLKGTFKVTAPKPASPGNAALGKVVFIQTGCNACHTLRAAKAAATIGTNLDRAKPSYATVVQVVTQGRTGSLGTMPTFGGTLTTAQIRNVAAFVYASTH
jgi:mono/diheme cytochrome c family protein